MNDAFFEVYGGVRCNNNIRFKSTRIFETNHVSLSLKNILSGISGKEVSSRLRGAKGRRRTAYTQYEAKKTNFIPKFSNKSVLPAP